MPLNRTAAACSRFQRTLPISRRAPTPAIKALLKCGLACEKEVTVSARVHRTGDLTFGIFITPAGLTAINVELDAGVAQAEAAAPQTITRMSKRDTVLGLLRREGGATLAELIEATSWLPHTTRAALTGLRKKGHSIECGRRDNNSFYRIVAATQ
jgi:hypothetical protein